jgi:hypothetical protein
MLVVQQYLDYQLYLLIEELYMVEQLCQDNRRVFFYADDGFFEINGDQVISIGAEKVNRFFDNDLNKAYTDRIVLL